MRGVGGVQAPGALGQSGCGAHAEGYGFAVQKLRIVRLGFQGVADGVAEIQNAAKVAFTFIGGDDFRFDAHGGGDDVFHQCRVLLQNLAYIAVETLE